MIGYYFHLAIRCMRGNVALTLLIIAAVGVGIGATMTVFTVLLAMSGDPIPAKSSQLFAPQIEVWGPSARRTAANAASRLPDMLTYRDAVALMQAHVVSRQAAMYGISQAILPPGGNPFRAGAAQRIATSSRCSRCRFTPGRPGAPRMKPRTGMWSCWAQSWPPNFFRKVMR